MPSDLELSAVYLDHGVRVLLIFAVLHEDGIKFAFPTLQVVGRDDAESEAAGRIFILGKGTYSARTFSRPQLVGARFVDNARHKLRLISLA